MSVQNGDVVILQIGGVQLGALVSNSQGFESDMLDKSNKDLAGVKQYDPGETGWHISIESLYDPAAAEGFSEVLGYLKAGTVLTVKAGIPNVKTFNGSALIASVDLSGPKNEISSYSLEIQGTSEVTWYGPVMNVLNCVNNDYDVFASGTPTGFNATWNTSGTQSAGTADEITIVSGRKYFIEFDEVLNSGTAPTILLEESLGGPDLSSGVLSANGSNAITLTAIGTSTGVVTFTNSAASNFEVTNLSVREII